jgi:O-antigen/teichoic acid export membrane protein
LSVHRNIFLTLLTQVPTLLFGFISSILVTRTIGAKGVGVVSIFQSDIELFNLFLSLSLAAAFVYFIASNKISITKLAGIAIIALFSGTFLLSAILFLVNSIFDQPFLFPKGHNTLFYNLYLIVVFFLTMFNTFTGALFQGRALFRYVNLVSIATSVLNLAGFSLMFIISRNSMEAVSVKWALCVTLTVVCINTALWLYLYIRHIGLWPSFRFSYRDEIKPLLLFVVIMYLSDLVNFFNYRLDLWIVEYYNGTEQVGYYSRAANVSQLLWVISIPIANVLIPYMTSSKKPGENSEVFTFFSRLNTTVVLFAVMLLILSADLIIPMVYGADFFRAVLPFKLLLAGILFSCMSKVMSLYPYVMGKVRYNLIATAVGFAFTVTLDILLIPKYGIIGASIASLVCYFSIFATNCFFVFVVLKVPFRNYFILTSGDVRHAMKKVRSFVTAKAR